MHSPLHRTLSRSIQLWVILAGHLFAILFLRDFSLGIDQINDVYVRGLAELVNSIHFWVFKWLAPVAVVFIILLQVQLIRGRPMQWGIDLLAGLLTLRCAMLFLILNLLLLTHLKAGGMLLMQLILFIPIITIDFGWIYWRLDSTARLQGRMHIKFSEAGEKLDPYDYFHVAAMTLLQFEPSGATPTSRLMKALFVLHGAMMLDLVALTLSRAISLASGG